VTVADEVARISGNNSDLDLDMDDELHRCEETEETIFLLRTVRI
jgi:hypothetical protein